MQLDSVDPKNSESLDALIEMQFRYLRTTPISYLKLAISLAEIISDNGRTKLENCLEDSPIVARVRTKFVISRAK